MKRFLTSALTAALAAGTFAKDANSDFHSFMLRMLPKIEQAFAAKNADFFSTISTPDFTETMGDTTMTGKQSIASMKQQFQMIDKMSCKFKLTSFSVQGNVGTAHTAGIATMTTKRQKPTDKPHTMVVHIWEKETWVRSGNTWKIKRLEQEKPPQTMMDGQPVKN